MMALTDHACQEGSTRDIRRTGMLNLLLWAARRNCDKFMMVDALLSMVAKALLSMSFFGVGRGVVRFLDRAKFRCCEDFVHNTQYADDDDSPGHLIYEVV